MGKPKEKGPPPPDYRTTPLAQCENEGINYSELVERYRKIVVEQTALESQRKDLSQTLQAFHLAIDIKKVQVGQLQAILGSGRTASRLDKGKLLLAGVDADVIKACTVAGTPYTYISVIPLEEEPPTYDHD